MIQAAMLATLRPEERKLPNYRGTEARKYSPADRRAYHRDRQSYLSIFRLAALGSLRVACISDRRGVVCATQEPGLDAYCVCVIRRGGAGLGSPHLKEGVGAGENQALIYKGAPGTRFTSSDDHTRLNVWIPAAKLRASLEALADRPMAGELVFSPRFDTTRGAGAGIGSLLGYLENDLSLPHSLPADPISAGLFEDVLCRSVVHGLEHSHSWLLQMPASAGLCSVRQAEEYLRAHLEEPVTLGDLARAARCSVRSLQIAFRQVRGVTPMAALRNARLEQARQALQGSEAGSVTDVALRFGFSNAGRFARFYQQAFGEHPRRTMHPHRR